MKLTFLGATHEVTGSCYLLEACQKRVLIDYGMEQGEDIFENAELPVKPSDIDMVLLTHAHMDHSGKLPLLYKEGFQGQIFSTAATADLCEIMLRDSAHIQMFEAEWKNRKGMRAGREMVQPLYDMEDAEGALRCFVRCRYGEEIRIAEGIKIRFIDAGHLLGSSSIEVWVKEGKTEKKIVFSGDIGNCNQPLIRDPQYPTQADYVLMESTYFHAPPYTSERAKQKVIDLAKKLTPYAGPINLHIVNFTDIQLYIYDKCPHDELTIIMRRYMMRIAEHFANETKSLALVTGESIGQVASQTMQSLAATNEVCSMPVFRPLIGFDKQEIIDVAEKIDTYETSILPFEDCCTIFVAKHPVTKPNLHIIQASEKKLSEKIDELVKTAIETTETVWVE